MLQPEFTPKTRSVQSQTHHCRGQHTGSQGTGPASPRTALARDSDRSLARPRQVLILNTPAIISLRHDGSRFRSGARKLAEDHTSLTAILGRSTGSCQQTLSFSSWAPSCPKQVASRPISQDPRDDRSAVVSSRNPGEASASELRRPMWELFRCVAGFLAKGIDWLWMTMVRHEGGESVVLTMG